MTEWKFNDSQQNHLFLAFLSRFTIFRDRIIASNVDIDSRYTCKNFVSWSAFKVWIGYSGTLRTQVLRFCVLNASCVWKSNLFWFLPTEPPTYSTCAQSQLQNHSTTFSLSSHFSLPITLLQIQAEMAAPANATPTFKLVLVGDGGTGKVSVLLPRFWTTTAILCDFLMLHESLRTWVLFLLLSWDWRFTLSHR